MTKTPWYKCSGKFLVMLLGITIVILGSCWLLRVRTFQDLYVTLGMAFNGPPLWRAIALRRIAAGDSIHTVTNQYPATHFSTRGHFRIICFHNKHGDVFLVSKDDNVVYGAADHYGNCLDYFDAMTLSDKALLEKEKYHLTETSISVESANNGIEPTR